MTHRPTELTLCLVLSTTCLAASFSTAAEAAEPFDAIPDSASAVVRLSGVDVSAEAVGQFVDRVQPGFGNIVRAQLPVLLGNVITNPVLAGIDRSRDWYVAGFAGDDADAVLYLPVSDATAAKETLQPDTQTIEHGDWLICGRKQSVMDGIQACLDGAKSIDAVMEDNHRQQFMGGTLALYVNGAPLKEAYADEIASAEERLDAALDQMITVVKSQNSQLEMGYVKEVYGQLGRMWIQAARDSETVVVTIDVQPDGIQIDKTVAIVPNSKTSAVFKTQARDGMEQLTRLPEDHDAYFAFHGDPIPLLEESETLMTSLLPDEESQTKVKQALDTMKKGTFGAFTGSMTMTNDETGALHYAGIMTVEPASVVCEAFEYYRTGLEYEVAGIKQTLSYEADAEKLGDQDVHIFRVTQEIRPELDPLGVQKAVMEKMYGPDGVTQRLVASGNTVYQTMGGGLDSLKSLIDSTPGWSSSSLVEARNKQLEQANMVTLFDIPNFFRQMVKIMASTGTIPLPLNAEQLDAVELPRTYVGSSVAVQETELKARLHIPADTVKGIVTLVMFGRSQLGTP